MGHMVHYNGLTIEKLRGGITVSNHNDNTYVQTSLFDDLMDVLKKAVRHPLLTLLRRLKN